MMNRIRSLIAALSGIMPAALLTLLITGTVAAQTTSQVDAMQVFQSLTPEQQQAALQGAAAFVSQDGATGAISARDRAAGSAARDARQGTLEAAAPPLPSMQPEDTVVVRLSLTFAGERPRELDDLISLVHSRNPYTLDRDSQLNLPGFAPIKIGGLTEEQATQRLSSEPALLPFTVRLLRLPVVRTGVAGLAPFGYDLFSAAPSTFSPVTDTPVPADYVMGAGDELNVQLFGSQNRTLRLVVNRDGSVTFPGLGPIRISGLTFNAARQRIESQVAERMLGVRANVAMGETRSIRVFVFGEARQPGSYTVSGLATMTTALFASGGVKAIASLRDIQLKRQGAVVRRLDLYDLLTRGETSIADLVHTAGGLTPEADTSRGNLTRIDEAGRRVVLNVNLDQPTSRSLLARNGDVLRIDALRPQLDAGVTLSGFVHRPGVVAWSEGLRLSEVIGSVDELKPSADQRYVLIRRESGPDRRTSVLSADLAAALAAPGSAADIALQSRDRIIVFELAPGRERIIQPLMDELGLQSDLARPMEVARVGGRVRAPGSYPLESGMRISDLLRAGGGLQAAAYGVQAELARYVVSDAGTRQTELVTIDLAALRRGEASADLPLRPYDNLLIKEAPGWTEESVVLKGEVRFPGVYQIRKGESLRQVLDRAGGVTAAAFLRGTVFTRRETRAIEQRQLDQLAERLQSNLASLSLEAAVANKADASQALIAGQSLLAQLRGARAVGRLIIDLPGLLAAAPGGAQDIELRDGDELVIPKQRNEVTVIGEVQNTTSHVYTRGLKRDAYINRSGGMTRKADRGRIYLVRADGSVIAHSSSWFKRDFDVAIEPGDSIVVPLDAEHIPKLPLLQSITQILYNVAVSVAAVSSF